MTLADLIVNLKLDASNLTAGLSSAQSSVNSYLTNLKTAFDDAGEQIAAQQSNMFAGGAALSVAITAPIVALGMGALDAAGKMESMRLGLGAVMGGATAAAEEITKLVEVAKLPGLGLPEAVQGSVRLQAVGLSADQARDALMGFGSAIATTGGGRAELDRVITQLTQMASAGTILTQDLRPVIQTVPLMAGVLRDLFGTIDAGAISKKLEQMGIDSKGFVTMVSAEFNKLPGVAGGVKNSLENTSDAITIALGKVGTALLPFVKLFTETFVPAISAMADAFVALPSPVQSTIVVVLGLAAAIGPLLLLVAGMSTGITAISGLLGVSGLTGIIGGLAGGITGLVTGAWALMSTAFVGFIPTLGTINFALGTGLVGALTAAELALMAASAAAALFVGWQIGSWAYSHIPGLAAFGDTVAELALMQIPYLESAILRLTGVTGAQKVANDDLDFATKKLEASLKTHGIEVDRGKLSADDYAKALQAAAKEVKSTTTETDKAKPSIDFLKQAHDKLAAGLKLTASESKALKDEKAKLKTEMDAAKKSAQELKSAYGALGLKDLKGEVDKLEGSIALLKKTGDWNKLSVDQQKTAVDKLKEAKFQAGEVTYDFTGKLLALTTQLKSTITESGFLFDAMEDIGDSLGDLNTDITALPMGMLNTDLMTQATNLGAATSQVGFLKDAYTTLGITSKADLQTVADEAAKARDAVLGSNEATDFEKKTAVYKALQAQITAAQQAGIDVPAEQLKMCEKMKNDLDKESGLAGVKTKWGNFSNEVSTIITNFAQSISDSLWDGDTSWGEKGLALLTDLGKAVTSSFITPAVEAITGFVTSTINGLLKGAFDNVGEWLGTLGSKMAGIFGGGVDVASGASGAAGSAGSAGGGAGAAASGAMATIGAIGSIGTMISSIIGNFQSAKMETTLNAIEESTRYTKIYIGDLLPKLVNDLATGIPLIHLYMIGDMQTAMTAQLTELETIKTSVGTTKGVLDLIYNWSLGSLEGNVLQRLDTIVGKMGSEPTTVNVYVETNASAEDIAAAVANALRTEGAPA